MVLWYLQYVTNNTIFGYLINNINLLDIKGLVLGLWCLTSFSTVLQLYRGGQFYWWKKPEYLVKTSDMPHLTDKLYHIMLYRVHLVMSGNRTHNVSGDMHWLQS